MNYKQLASKLVRLRCKEIPRRSGGSHRKWYNPASRKGTVIPYHGKRDLKMGTVKAIIKQLGIDLDVFDGA
jgi:mRNA interferase HicA